MIPGLPYYYPAFPHLPFYIPGPRIKALEFFPNGRVKRVEFY